MLTEVLKKIAIGSKHNVTDHPAQAGNGEETTAGRSKGLPTVVITSKKRPTESGDSPQGRKKKKVKRIVIGDEGEEAPLPGPSKNSSAKGKARADALNPAIASEVSEGPEGPKVNPGWPTPDHISHYVAGLRYLQGPWLRMRLANNREARIGIGLPERKARLHCVC